MTLLKKLANLALNNAPIRKVLVAALASAVIFLARQFHVTVGSREVTDALTAAIPVISAYLTPDPQVRA